MKTTNEQVLDAIAEASVIDVAVPGKMSSIVGSIINSDNETQTGEFGIDEQRERLRSRTGLALENHPELKSWAIDKLMAQAQGRCASVGLSLLKESFDAAGETKQVLMFIPPGLTLKLADNRQIQFKHATSEHVFKVYERLKDVADAQNETAKSMLKGLAWLSGEMERRHVLTIGELADKTGKVEFQIAT